MESLNEQIRLELSSAGADLVGFADISALPVKMRGSMTRAISIGARLDPSVVSELADGPTQRYWREYDRLNALLEQLCKTGVDILRRSDAEALAIEATTAKFDEATLSEQLPHKAVATRAGLGWIGKSALLITPQFGPAMRLGTVLTNADFETGEPVNTSNCGKCRECVEKCPANAIVGPNWELGTARESIYDAFACRKKVRVMAKQRKIVPTICGICINACPWTQRYLSRESDGVEPDEKMT
jgi:epoxyqueuosine reductase QueG